MKKASSKIFTASAVLLAALSVLVWLPRLFGCSAYYVSTGSMSPSIPKGSFAFAKAVSLDEIKKGDVLVFENYDREKNFMHRVVAVNKTAELVYTKGDANAFADPLPTSFECCRGRVVFHVPLLGYVAQAAGTFAGKIIIVLVYVIFSAVAIERLRVTKKKEVSA